ncbi:MAG: MoaD/ThiS family protein [Bacillota bacterium]|nr:MoaD/ThiS family protein [Bacillota bacterium]
MKLTIKLFPPYRKKGDSGEHSLELDQGSVTVEQLSQYLFRDWKDKFDYPIIDERHHLTAEFMVNGKHVSTGHSLEDGDQVSVIPYLCGG